MMRSVGPVVLAVALVAVALVGAATAAGVAHSQPAASSESSVGADVTVRAPSLFDPPTLGPGPARSHERSDSARQVAVEHEATARTAAERSAPVARADGTSAVGATRQEDPDVSLTQEFRLTPDQAGHVAVTHNYSLADRIAELRTTVPRRGSVATVEGFSRVNETIYRWDGRTMTPSITYSLPVNETGSRNHAAGNGSLLFADVGEWALLRRPSVSTRWKAFGRWRVSYDRRTETAGAGAAGKSLVYLGNVTLHPRTAANQTFRLAVPEAANLTASPDDILDAMERASADLDVGDRDEAVFAVAAPTEGVPWAVRGLSVGDADFWVDADEEVGTTDNVWIHEYVHTRQDYRPTTTTEWTVEAFPTYYAAYHAFRYDSVTFAEFSERLAISNGSTPNATLADPATWGPRTAYDRGSLVAGQIDRRLRAATNGNRTLDSVLAAMNNHSGRVNASEFFAAVGGPRNLSVRATMRSSVYTDHPISMWNRSQHVAAFGSMPPRFVYALPRNDRDYRVRGPYRNTSLVGDNSYTLVTGETFVVDARVYNAGDARGYYEAPLRVNGTVVDTDEGRLLPKGVAFAELNHTFTAPGPYRIGVGNDTATVVVRSPARASVVAIQVMPQSIEQYQRAVVTVTVQNEGPLPATRELRIRRGNRTVATPTATVDSYTTTTVTVPVEFPMGGPTTVAVEGAGTVNVSVEPSERPRPGLSPTPTGSSRSTTTNGSGLGFGAIAALFALVASTLVARYVR